jgi:ribonuclease E
VTPLSPVEGQPPVTEGAEAERDEQRRRRRRRGGRGGRDEAGAEGSEAGAETAAFAEGGAADADAPAADVAHAARPDTDSDAPSDDAAAGEGRRRGRGRDRFRRDRREEGAPGEESAASTGETGAELPLAEPVQAVADAGALPLVTEATPKPLPVVEPFVLPIAELQGLAEASGLQWVNSDPDRIRAAQDAIAAEPAPAHVPRERKAVVLVDEGPLVLVETRKDLSQMKLPFENGRVATPG